MAELADAAHAAGALMVAVVEPTSLALLAAPGSYGADIVAAEGQPLGIPPSYGGPYVGLMAARMESVRQMPGRLVGATRDGQGRKGYVLTLQAREQHIRREKAASNICTNQALCALAAATYLSAVGPEGLREVADLSATQARHVAAAIESAGLGQRRFSAPYFAEVAIRIPDAARRHAALAEQGIVAGYLLGGRLSRAGGHAPAGRHRAHHRCRRRGPGGRPGVDPMSVLERPATADASGRGAAFTSPEAGDELTIIEPLIFRRIATGTPRGPLPAPRRMRPERQRAGQPPIPEAATRATAAAPARGRRARPAAPLQSAQPPEPRHRAGLLPARLVHDEVQPQGQRMGGPPPRPRRFAPARSRSAGPGQPGAGVAAGRSCSRRSAASRRSASSRPPAPTAS